MSCSREACTDSSALCGASMMVVPREPRPTMTRSCFHLSIPAIDLEATVRWYVDGLGCRPGRRSPDAAILDLGGHQLVAQRLAQGSFPESQRGIYPRHFGLVFEEWNTWRSLHERVSAAGIAFAVAPKCRFPGEVLEHHTFFLTDPSDNWLEFKHYSHPEAILGCVDQAVVGDALFR
jgi:extradiol dioxygenase family protein